MFVYKLLLYLVQIVLIFQLAAASTFEYEQEPYCQLQIPNSRLIINVTRTSDFSVSLNASTHEFIRLNLCTPLDNKCGHENGYAACFYKSDGTRVGVGKFPPTPSVSESDHILTYLGDQCNATHKFSVRVTMSCDTFTRSYSIENRSYGNCEFYVALRTARACGYLQKYTCTLRHQTHHYSLKRLRNHKTNYIVPINRTLSIIFNVCQSLTRNPYTNCGPKSAICLIDQSNYTDIKYSNLGNIDEHPGITYASDGVINIHYEKGPMCKNDNGKQMKSTISFICDLNAKEGYAEYLGGLESCHLFFVWKTAAACNEEELVNSSLTTRKPCRVTDPIDGYTYDFSKMYQDGRRLRQENHNNYHFSVCKAVDNQSIAGSGMYKTSSKYANLLVLGGMVNSQLSWSPNMGVYLNYSGGDECAVDRYRNTVIRFRCTSRNIFLVSENQCSTTIKFVTGAACPKTCPSFRRTQFDNLINSAARYEIKRDKTVYSFSLCESINPMKIDNCWQVVAGICLFTYQTEHSFEETSLGYPETYPIAVSEQITLIKYVNGSTCEEDGTKRLSSHLSLICDIDVTNSLPTFDRYENCIHHFVWRSRQSCGTIDCKMNANCSVENELGHRWDLTPLRNMPKRSVPSKKKNVTYEVDFCGKSNILTDSTVSTKEINFGKLLKVSSSYATNITLKLYFSHGSSCANGSSRAKSVLILKCDESRGAGEPILLWEEECSVAIEWRTRLVCTPEIKSSHWLLGTIVIFLSAVLIMAVIAGIFLVRSIYPHGIMKKSGINA